MVQKPSMKRQLGGLVLSAFANVFSCFVASYLFCWGLNEVIGVTVGSWDMMLLVYGMSLVISFMVSVVTSFNN